MLRIVHLSFQRNILINNEGVPVLADFGLSWFCNVTEVRHDQGSSAWQAPELLGVLEPIVHPDGPERTRESDVYALGCTFFEVSMSKLLENGKLMGLYKIWTGQPPFYDNPKQGDLLQRLRRGDRPRREPVPNVLFWKTIPDWLWDIITRCWSQKPSARPTAASVVKDLESAALDK